MIFSFSAWDRCVDLARTSEGERARLWDLCSDSIDEKSTELCQTACDCKIATLQVTICEGISIGNRMNASAFRDL